MAHPALTRRAVLRLPSLFLLASAPAAAQEERKEPPRFPLRLELGKGAGWTSSTRSVRDEEASHRQKLEATIGGESHKQEDTLDLLEHEETDSRVRMEFLETEEGEIRRARYTLEEQRYRRRREKDGEVVEKDEAPKSAEIEGCEISFRWGEEENDVQLKGGSLDKEEREGFAESLKFRDLNPLVAYLLPKEPVAVGETWTLEGRPVRQILNHALGDSEDEARAKKSIPKGVRFDVTLDGELKAKLVEVEEKAGRRVAVVSVSGKPKEEGSSEEEGSGSTWKTAYEVTGTLRFLLEPGLPESFEFSIAAKTQSSRSGDHEGADGEGGLSFSVASGVTVKREFRTVCVPLREAEDAPAKESPQPRKDG